MLVLETVTAISDGNGHEHSPGISRRMERPLYEFVKRVFDVVAAGSGLVLLWPLLFALAIAIRLDSPGPALYTAVRTGRWGKPFRILKLRTMVVDADRDGMTTALGDPRTTRVGCWLRRWKLDELPQLLNVVRGDMSIVGPRPELPYYTARYVGDERDILTVLPGITDYSSIRFRALDRVVGPSDADLAFEAHVLAEKNRLRVRYVRERGFLRDLGIIMRTLIALVRW